MVTNKPYLVWSEIDNSKSIAYLERINPDYFSYIADLHLSAMEDDEATEEVKQFSAIELRRSYSQALETLFAFLLASIQAPQHVQQWLTLYQPRDLKECVSKIRKFRPIESVFGYKYLKWCDFTQHIFRCMILDDTEKQEHIKNEFANLWSRLASDYTNDSVSREYNSIKHGYRAKPGSFFLAISPDHSDKPSEKETLAHVLAQTEYGTSFIVRKNMQNTNKELYFRQTSIGWIPEEMAFRLSFIAMSLRNLLSCLLILNGKDPTQVQFHWNNNNVFDEYWCSDTGRPGSFSTGPYEFEKTGSVNWDKETILSAYRDYWQTQRDNLNDILT